MMQLDRHHRTHDHHSKGGVTAQMPPHHLFDILDLISQDRS